MGERINTGKKVLYFFLAIVVAISYLLFQEIGYSIVMNLPDSVTGGDPEKWFNAHSYMVDALECVGMLVIYMPWYFVLTREPRGRLKAEKLSGQVPRLKPGKTVLMIVVVTFGCSGLSYLWLTMASTVLKDVPLIKASLESFDQAWADEGQHPYFWVLMSVAVIGPIVEELMFRGIIFRYLEKISSIWMPIIVSGIMFGIWHMELVQSVYTAVMGIIIAIVYAKTRSMWTVIGIHIFNNFMSSLPPSWDTDGMNTALTIISVICIVPTLIIVFFYGRELNRRQALLKAQAA